MSLVSLLRFARGTVTFTVKGAFAERFLNLLSRNEIPVFHTRCTPEGYTAQTTVKHYRRIRPFVRKTHVRVRVSRRRMVSCCGLSCATVKRYSLANRLPFGILLAVIRR